jgi:pimeloyl-ACP methyl ester carboxylesterase
MQGLSNNQYSHEQKPNLLVRANTSLEALIQSHSNAFSVIAPAILNSNFMIDLKNLSSDSRFKMWTAWGITSQRQSLLFDTTSRPNSPILVTVGLCDSIGDGILALNHGSADKMYLPDVDWEELQHQLGDSPMYAHFLKGPQASREALSETSRSSLIDSVRQMALKVLDVDPSEFSPNIPFTSYGLDSLSAGRLAFMLRPYLSITQVQLLSDMSLADLHRQIEVSEQKSSDEEANRGRFNWSALNQSGQTVVPLVDGDGPPLIVIHGTSGNIVALFPLQERFNSPLWAIQTTPETPLGSIEEMSMFYFREIKAMRPVGPYRLAGFSGISLITFHLALLFEWNGDHVVQLVMLDHFPTLFSLPSLFPLDDETVTTNAPSGALISQCFSQLFGLYARDPSPSRQVILERLTDLLNGRSVDDPIIRSYYEVFIKILTMVANFVLNGFAEESDGSDLRARMERWVTQVKAPVTVIVAKKGTVVPIPEWDDLGCRACFPDARVTYIDSGHFSMLEMDTVVDELQHGW